MSDSGAGTTTPPAWYADLDEAHRGHVTSRGWDKMDPAEAARAAVAAHRQAQGEFSRVHGVPADQLMRMPKDAADPGWAELHKRLGVPEKPEDYKIEGLAFADGKAPDEKFIGHMRALAHELKLPAGQAQALAARVIALADNDRTTAGQSESTQRGANEAELRRNWGSNHDYYRFQATRAAQVLGVPDDVVKAMEARPAAEYTRFMDNLRGFAGKMGEAELLRGEQGDNTRTLTREEAVARREDLMKDRAFAMRYVEGDTNAIKEMENLARIIVGPPPQGAAPNQRR